MSSVVTGLTVRAFVVLFVVSTFVLCFGAGPSLGTDADARRTALKNKLYAADGGASLEPAELIELIDGAIAKTDAWLTLAGTRVDEVLEDQIHRWQAAIAAVPAEGSVVAPAISPELQAAYQALEDQGRELLAHEAAIKNLLERVAEHQKVDARIATEGAAYLSALEVVS